MSLPACQQRVLDRIDVALQSGEPRLASMFAIFTRLTRDEGRPRTESIEPAARRPWRRIPATRLRMIVIIPVIVSLVVGAVLLGISTSGSPTCRPATGLHNPAASRIGTCQAAPNWTRGWVITK